MILSIYTCYIFIYTVYSILFKGMSSTQQKTVRHFAVRARSRRTFVPLWNIIHRIFLILAHLFTYSFTRALTHSFARSLTHSLKDTSPSLAPIGVKRNASTDRAGTILTTCTTAPLTLAMGVGAPPFCANASTLIPWLAWMPCAVTLIETSACSAPPSRTFTQSTSRDELEWDIHAVVISEGKGPVLSPGYRSAVPFGPCEGTTNDGWCWGGSGGK